MSLSERLREFASGLDYPDAERLVTEAATTIDTQAAEIERLRASLARPEPSEAVVGERTFNDWYEEMEGYALRLERAVDDLGPKAEAWLRAAYDQGKADASRATP